jgi:hypothetical protein
MGNANSSLESTRDDSESTRDDSESTRDDSESMKLERTNVAVEGELVGLLIIGDHTSNTPKISTDQCIKRLDRIIELLPTHIEFMTSHSDDIIDMNDFSLMCADIYKRFKFSQKQIQLSSSRDFPFQYMPSNKSIIKDETKLLHHLKIIADIIRGSQHEDLPGRGGRKWMNLKMFLYHMARTDSPHDCELKENFHEIANYLDTREGHYHKWGTTMRCIRWYIETLKEIIDMIQTNTLDPKDAANLDECILVPGCNLFGISKKDQMTTLLQLVSNAEELLRFKMSLIEIDWIARRQTLSSLIPATRLASTPTLANAAKANAAKALLISDPLTRFTPMEREKVLASGGIMTSLVDALVQPPSQMQPKELAQLKRMISNRRSGGTHRRKTKSKSMKIKHLTQPK